VWINPEKCKDQTIESPEILLVLRFTVGVNQVTKWVWPRDERLAAL